MISVNIVFTFHNRKEKTMRCLESIKQQRDYNNYKINFFACDDGSDDGTALSLKKMCPNITIVEGDGTLYWAKGMSKAMIEAKKSPCDYYLMINDDVVFYDSMFTTMFSAVDKINSEIFAITGACCDEITKEYSYGGVNILPNHILDKTVQVLPNDPLNECDRANWNCFLIPSKVYQLVGDIDDYYAHSMADFDYSYRLKKMGGHIYVSHMYVGECCRNSINGTASDTSLGLLERIHILNSPRGIPFKSSFHYAWKISKKWAFIRAIFPYLCVVKSAIFKGKEE